MQIGFSCWSYWTMHSCITSLCPPRTAQGPCQVLFGMPVLRPNKVWGRSLKANREKSVTTDEWKDDYSWNVQWRAIREKSPEWPNSAGFSHQWEGAQLSGDTMLNHTSDEEGPITAKNNLRTEQQVPRHEQGWISSMTWVLLKVRVSGARVGQGSLTFVLLSQLTLGGRSGWLFL